MYVSSNVKKSAIGYEKNVIWLSLGKVYLLTVTRDKRETLPEGVQSRWQMLWKKQEKLEKIFLGEIKFKCVWNTLS